MASSFADRLVTLRTALGLTQDEMTQRLKRHNVKVSTRTLGAWERSTYEPPEHKRIGIERVLDLLDPHSEAMNGQETPEDDPDDGVAIDYAELQRQSNLPDRDLARRGLVRIPLVEVSAGPALEVEIVTVAESAEVLPEWYIRQVYGVAPERFCLIKVRGDSMNGPPSWIAPGSILRGLVLGDGEPLRHGAIYAIVGPDGVQFKRIYLRAERSTGGVERAIHLWSDNESAGRDLIPAEVWERDYRAAAIALTVEKEL